MNRIEFMTQLAALLQDIPVIERQEAMKYYNDYFDDAGEENEQTVIEELGSPEKIAATIKADLGVHSEDAQRSAAASYGEYRETGYTDARFEQKDRPVVNQQPPKTSSALKVILIIAILFVGAPVIFPLAMGIIAVLFACVVTIAALFFAIVIAFVAIAVTGVILFFSGLATLIPEMAVGLALTGTGLILGVTGVAGTVASIKLCTVVLPGIFRGIIWVCRKPFERKAVA